ncbi:hypothetical protein [Streptomyces cirratus]|uniref:hypothetical protein n=1 Tax=Streptomyces cirratus TaxID=68187 RepID=UPI003606226E
MSRLHVFDLDGTLLRGTTASLEIARRLDCLPELRLLEEKFAAGALDTRGFAAEVCRLWADLTPGAVADAFATAPWIGDCQRSWRTSGGAVSTRSSSPCPRTSSPAG